ncbi:LysR family transcriptional regulator [Labrys neptuniae]
MSESDLAHIRRLDLTLLLLFEAISASGKLTLAGRQLGLTQSAVSHALKRLREIFDDELFVRIPHGVQPTPRAIELRKPLAEALHLISTAVAPADFDPTRDHRVFRIAATDYEASLIASSLANTLTQPIRSQVIIRPLVRRQAIDALNAGAIDLMIGYSWENDPGCESLTLYDEDYLVVARPGHPIFEGELDVERYAGCDHVLVSPGGSLHGIVDHVLAGLGRSRRVALAVPYFLTAMTALARSDMIATLPRRLVRCHLSTFGLGSAEPPVEIRRFPVRMLWSKRLGTDPAIVWLKDRLIKSLQMPG